MGALSSFGAAGLSILAGKLLVVEKVHEEQNMALREILKKKKAQSQSKTRWVHRKGT